MFRLTIDHISRMFPCGTLVCVLILFTDVRVGVCTIVTMISLHSNSILSFHSHRMKTSRFHIPDLGPSMGSS